MSFSGGLRHTPATTKPPEITTSMGGSDPLQNLSAVQARMDTVQKFLSNSISCNTLIAEDQMEIVSAEIVSAIHQIIVNGAAILASSQTQNTHENSPPKSQQILYDDSTTRSENPKAEELKEDEDYEIIELDSVELLAEHIHFCEICGKGFKRDANLRMHMRAHGDQFKTMEALAKPADAEKCIDYNKGRRTRFSCPFSGCNRNKQHKKFRQMKSVISVKNHFKRSHCPKMYTCTRCNNKSFSIVADLKNHLKHCGETKWKCSCGTSFSRKDRLFGHMALFDGHLPANVVEEDDEDEVEVETEIEGQNCGFRDVKMRENSGHFSNNGIIEGWQLDGFESIDNYCLQDVFSSPNFDGPASGVDGFFNY